MIMYSDKSFICIVKVGHIPRKFKIHLPIKQAPNFSKMY